MRASLKEREYAGGARGRTAHVLAEVATERDRQDTKWGGPAHDDEHNPRDFCSFLFEHTIRAERALAGEPVREYDEYRQQMLRVTALAVAALEQWDRHWKPALDRAEGERLAQETEARLAKLYGPDESKWPQFRTEGR